jgi:hypothetical protein
MLEQVLAIRETGKAMVVDLQVANSLVVRSGLTDGFGFQRQLTVSTANWQTRSVTIRNNIRNKRTITKYPKIKIKISVQSKDQYTDGHTAKHGVKVQLKHRIAFAATSE